MSISPLKLTYILSSPDCSKSLLKFHLKPGIIRIRFGSERYFHDKNFFIFFIKNHPSRDNSSNILNPIGNCTKRNASLCKFEKHDFIGTFLGTSEIGN